MMRPERPPVASMCGSTLREFHKVVVLDRRFWLHVQDGMLGIEVVFDHLSLLYDRRGPRPALADGVDAHLAAAKLYRLHPTPPSPQGSRDRSPGVRSRWSRCGLRHQRLRRLPAALSPVGDRTYDFVTTSDQRKRSAPPALRIKSQILSATDDLRGSAGAPVSGSGGNPRGSRRSARAAGGRRYR